MGGAGKSRGDLFSIAEMEIQADIPRRRSCTSGAPGRSRGTGGRDGGQRIDVDEDRLGGILRELWWFPPRPSLSVRRHSAHDLVASGRCRGRGVGEHRDASLRRPACSRCRPVQVRSGNDQRVCQAFHAPAGSIARISPWAIRLRTMTPIQLTGRLEIVGIAPLAAQEHRVFLARHRLANGKFLGRPATPDRMAHSSRAGTFP